jgi:hypothetical protein
MNLEPIDTSTTAGKEEVERLYSQGREVAVAVRGFPLWMLAKYPKFNWDAMEYAIILEDLAGRDE